MKRYIMTMRFWQDVEFEVEANNYDDAITQAYELAHDFPDEALEDIQCALYVHEEIYREDV